MDVVSCGAWVQYVVALCFECGFGFTGHCLGFCENRNVDNVVHLCPIGLGIFLLALLSPNFMEDCLFINLVAFLWKYILFFFSPTLRRII